MATSTTQAADPTIDKPPCRRRWIPLSIRIFAIVLALFVMSSGWLVFRATRQNAAVREIERLGGQALILQKGPTWARQRLGHEWMSLYNDVVIVDLDKTHASDATLRQLTWLTSLTGLSLNGTQVTDAGIEQLQGLTKLDTLSLDRTKISDASVGKLKTMKTLRVLFLGETAITDAGADQIQELKKLEHLNQHATKLTDAGLGCLRSLPALRELHIGRTAATESGIADFKKAAPRVKVWKLHSGDKVIFAF